MSTTKKMYLSLLRQPEVPDSVIRAAFDFGTTMVDEDERSVFLADICEPDAPVDVLRRGAIWLDGPVRVAAIRNSGLPASDRTAAIERETDLDLLRDMAWGVTDPDALHLLAEKALAAPDGWPLAVTLLSRPTLPASDAVALLTVLDESRHRFPALAGRGSLPEVAAKALTIPGVLEQFVPAITCPALLREVIERASVPAGVWAQLEADLPGWLRGRTNTHPNAACGTDQVEALLETIANARTAPTSVRIRAAEELERLRPSDFAVQITLARLRGDDQEITARILADASTPTADLSGMAPLAKLVPELAGVIAAHPECGRPQLEELKKYAPRTPAVFAPVFEAHPDPRLQGYLALMGPWTFPLITADKVEVVTHLLGQGTTRTFCADLLMTLSDTDRRRLPWRNVPQLAEVDQVGSWVNEQLAPVFALHGAARLLHEISDAFDGTFQDLLATLTSACEPAPTQHRIKPPKRTDDNESGDEDRG